MAELLQTRQYEIQSAIFQSFHWELKRKIRVIEREGGGGGGQKNSIASQETSIKEEEGEQRKRYANARGSSSYVAIIRCCAKMS